MSATAMPQAASASPMPAGGNLTETFKKQLIDEGIFVEERMDDATLLRFLRARKFDLAKAKEMLIAAEQWRKDYGVDDIIKNFDFKEKKEVDKYYPQYYHKTDKDGQLDIAALYAVTTQERQLKRLVSEYERSAAERFPASSKAFGHPVETSCTILDLHNVKDYDRYPETMGKFYIINAPWAFSAVWSIIKPWLDPVTVAKISILGSNYQETLLQQIPAENLPKEFGGKCQCQGGCSLSDAGPWKEDEGASAT
ncbi:CRAL-TRIO domain-containing protein [Lyophyllum atratum]|nr:CRAL-TRIO domain-containing protein [Lyophyllum atratum]